MADDHLLDETISAVLDGEATPAEARHAAECALCGARLQEFRRAASIIGSRVAPVAPTARDAAITRALAARVVSLPRRRVPLGWLASAAAVLVVLALAIPLVSGGGSDDDRDDTAASKDATEEFATGAGGEATADAAPGPVALGDLGNVDEAELQVRVRDALSPSAASTTTGAERSTELAAPSAGADESTCAQTLSQNNPDFGVLRATGEATFKGRPATVLAFGSADGRILVFAVARDACDEILLSITFPAP